MEIRVLESPGSDWDEFARKYTDIVFYQAAWSEVLRQGMGGKPLYFCLHDGGKIVAGLPGVTLDFKILKVLYSSIPYGNFIGERQYFPHFLQLLESEFKSRHIGQVRLSDSPFLEHFKPADFRVVTSKCSILELKGVTKEKLWTGYGKDNRRDIRRAQRRGVRVRQGSSQDDIETLYQLYMESMKRNRAAAKYPLRLFEAIYGESKLGTILLAELNDETTIAGIGSVDSPSVTHGLHAGSKSEFLKSYPNDLLIHTALERAIDKGHHFFDFGGVPPGDTALLRFKEKWESRSSDLHNCVKDYRKVSAKVWEAGLAFATSSIGSTTVRFFRRLEAKQG